jgi:hypothetical protein
MSRYSTPTNPYGVVVSGLMMPQFTSMGSEVYLYTETREFVSTVSERYPIITCRYNLFLRILFPVIIFAPRTIATKVLRPLILRLKPRDYHNEMFETFLPENNPIDTKTGLTVATKNISLVDVVQLKEYTPKGCYGNDACNPIPYLVAPRLRVKSRIAASELAFLGKVEAGRRVSYRGLTFCVDGQLENLEELLDQVRHSVGFTSSLFTRRITTLVMFARNQLFINANEPLPLSKNGRYTIARIVCRGNSMNLLIIDWDDDLLSSRNITLPLYDLLEVWVSGDDIDYL